jgi:hypothetical protein
MLKEEEMGNFRMILVIKELILERKKEEMKEE